MWRAYQSGIISCASVLSDCLSLWVSVSNHFFFVPLNTKEEPISPLEDPGAQSVTSLGKKTISDTAIFNSASWKRSRKKSDANADNVFSVVFPGGHWEHCNCLQARVSSAITSHRGRNSPVEKLKHNGCLIRCNIFYLHVMNRF